ncbi:hypothetical protein BaRGS_00027301 [Batillaria attramentaria]|uniref:Carnosine N-methyltransferase n=1 Tax=Batillaria attramentaria TaxID=370345 RepID=A0ABD0K3L2_9CAEN
MADKAKAFGTAESREHLSDEDLKNEMIEHEHFLRVIEAFKSYRSHCLRRIQSAEDYFLEMPEHHQQYLPGFRDNLDVMRTCVAHNHEVIKMLLQDAEVIFENKNHGNENPHLKPTAFDMDKVKTTIKQFYRDWSEAGREERAACYGPVLTAVEKRFPPDTHDPRSVNILVPGSGLGRLAHEFARRGYSCQGNEWSLFMLIASNFVLNKCKDTNDYRLYPWVHQWSNNVRSSHQTAHITFPDVNPSELPDGVNFSMAAGDFLEVYHSPGVWDCVSMVFFLDTAHNVVSYVETVWKILKPGGYWINLGPLLYHYSDVPGESSVELSYEDLRSVICKIGFDIEEEKENVKATYTQNPLAMLQYEYRCVYFVARKPLDAPVS